MLTSILLIFSHTRKKMAAQRSEEGVVQMSLRFRFYSLKATMLRILLIALLLATTLHAAEPKNIVIVAGKKSHGPEGNGIHDYGWSAKLVKVLLDNSNIHNQVRVQYHLDGWPQDQSSFETADSILIISDGRDGNLYEEAPHLQSDDRVKFLRKQIDRGCGLMTFHFSTFAPDKYADFILHATGGYFDWETDGQRKWYSAIKTDTADIALPSPQHPISRSLKPFNLKEEFYFNIRFPAESQSVTPLWEVPALPGRPEQGKVVAWAHEGPNGNRGFGTTVGHFYNNWKQDQFRKMILNALAWTAKVNLPEQGVESTYATHAQITAALAGVQGTAPAKLDTRPIKALLFAGNTAHKWHNWEKTTPAIKALLERDPRITVNISYDIEDLSRKNLADYQLIVQNYCNWQDPKPLSAQSQTAFANYLQNGGGLLLIHFANGAFHFSLPKAEASDWPEYRKIARRVWDHKSTSGHDPFGQFQVNITPLSDPITTGLKSFDVNDELYFRQAGTEPVTPLIIAHSKVTKQDEPLAWTYTYGKGKIFQTLLGHSEKTYDVFEPREMLRRAAAWTASRPIVPLTPADDPLPKPPTQVAKNILTSGRFGQALDTRISPAAAPGKKAYRRPPLTAELHAQLFSKANYNILLANETKGSPTHWEIFSMPGSGHFTAYLPGHQPDHVHSTVDIADGKWHHLGFVYEPERIRLYVDGKLAADQKVTARNSQTTQEELMIGSLVERGIESQGLIDDVRISTGARDLTKLSTSAASPDDQTVSLWSFDTQGKDKFPDTGSLKNAARPGGNAPIPAAQRQGPIPPDGPNATPADSNLQIKLVSRSEEDAYMAVKTDRAGQLFVGARDALFKFRPDGNGGFLPREEIYRFPKDSLIMGLEYRGEDLYVLTANALYLLSGARTQTTDIKPKRLIWGLPLDLHISFHCLAWGPEGDLYLNHGDPLLNYGDYDRADHWGHWTYFCQPEGTRIPYTGVGAVLRCKPDGSQLRVVATGLRGPVGLAFDPHWNLFTNENDHESRADLYAPAKLMHVTPHIDFGWPRGWIASKTPNRHDLIEPMIATLGRGVPCDLAYYGESLLPEKYHGTLLMDRWDRSTIQCYPYQPRGSSFQTPEQPFIQGENLARPVGLCVAADGRLFATAQYLTSNVWSPYCASDLWMITTKDNPHGQSVDLTHASPDTLWSNLSSPSWETRRTAHTEILRREGDHLTDAVQRFNSLRDNDPAYFHLPWLAAYGNVPGTPALLEKLFTHPRPELRQLAVRILTEYPHLAPSTDWTNIALKDKDPTVQLAALAACFDPAASFPIDTPLNLAMSTDTYLRQTATRLLAQKMDERSLAQLFTDTDPKIRLAAVLIAGTMLTVPTMHSVPSEKLPLNYPSQNAFFQLKFADTPDPIDLKKLGRTGSFTIAESWKLVPHTPREQQLFQQLAATLDDADDTVRWQSLYFLHLLNDPQIEPRLAQTRQALRLSPLKNIPDRPVSRLWQVGPFSDVQPNFAQAHPPEQGLLNLAATYPANNQNLTWQPVNAHASHFTIPASSGPTSWYFVFDLQSVQRHESVLWINGHGSLKLWHNGRPIHQGPLPTAERAPLFLDIQPGSNTILLRVQTAKLESPLTISLRAPSSVFPSLPEKIDAGDLIARLKSAASSGDAATTIPESFLKEDWNQPRTREQAAEGRKLFGSLGCAKCHPITPDQQGSGAPSLAEAKKRFNILHIVESVLLPNKQVAEPFRASLIVTNEGKTLTGLVVQDTPEAVELLLPDTTRMALKKSEIEERKLLETSPMPHGLVKTPTELHALLAYLLSDVPLPP